MSEKFTIAEGGLEGDSFDPDTTDHQSRNSRRSVRISREDIRRKMRCSLFVIVFANSLSTDKRSKYGYSLATHDNGQ